MNKIKDERLVLKNLQNIRVAFVVQTLGIFFILGYELVTKGSEQMISNPLWLVFITTMTVLTLLSIGINVEYDRKNASPKKTLTSGLVILTLITLVISFLVSVTPGYNWYSALITGLAIFACGFLSLMYVYMVKRRANDE